MKTRVITAVVALIIFVPILIAGGLWIQAAASLLAVIAASEVVLMRKTLLVDFGAILTMLIGICASLWGRRCATGLWREISNETDRRPNLGVGTRPARHMQKY